MPNLEIAQISDEEAQNLLGQYDEASPERQGYIGTALRQYQGQRAEIDSVDADAHFEKLFTDDDYFKQTSDQSQIQTAASVSPFPNAVKYRGANQAYLAHQLGVDSESLNGAAYEAQRDGYAKAYLAKDGGITDEAFFSGVKSQQQKKIDTRNAINEIPADIVAARFEDLDTGATRSTAELLQAWKNKHADIVPSDGDESVALRSAAQFFAENDEWMSRNASQAKAIFQTLKGFSAGEGKSDTEPVEGENPLRDLGAQLSEMSPEDRMRLYGMAALYAQRTGDPKGYFQQLGESVSRTVGEFGQSARSANREALLSSRLQELETGRANTLTGAPVAASEEERSTEAERIKQQLGAIQVSRELFQVARGEIDPITPLTEGWVGRLEEGSYNAAGSVPYLAAAAIPFAGTPLAIAAYSTQEYDRIRLEYPDISIGEAQGMALVSGSVQGALDKLQAEAVLGRLPMTGALLRNFAKPTTPFLARLAAGSGLNFTEQFGQETLQNITPLVVDEAARALGADMPDRDWNKELENAAKRYPNEDRGFLESVVINDYINSGVPDWIVSPESRSLASTLAKDQEQFDTANRLVKLYGLDRKTTPFTPDQMYKNLEGEAMSRLVQKRKDMTQDELLNSLAFDYSPTSNQKGLDVRPENLLYLNESGEIRKSLLD